jgi:hypothetical protein
MPPPKDPIKYAEYIKRQSASHMGHISPRKGTKHKPESIKKMQEAKMGKYIGENNPFYGKRHTQSTLKLMKSHTFTETHCENLSKSMKGRRPWNIGRPVPEYTRNKLSEAQKGEKSAVFGIPKSLETRTKISNALKGKLRTQSHCENISKNRIGKCRGDQNPNWNGGTSNGGYCYKFNERRKQAVRTFFKACILCDKTAEENKYTSGKQVALSVHHIDHDKEQGCNGRPFNLVPLCIECHAFELHNQEEFKEKINNILDDGFESGKWSREQYEHEVMYSE